MEEFDDLVRLYYSPLLTYITRACGSEAAAEDILQEVFLQIWRGRDSLPKDGNLRAYLYTVARHRMLDYTRSERRSVAREEQYVFGEANIVNEPALDSLEQKELAQALRAAIDRLPERAREVWRLNREQGLTYQEISQVLGVSVNTVKTHMARAGAAIRQALVPFI